VALSNQRSLRYKKVRVCCGNPNGSRSPVLGVRHMSDEATCNELMPRML
jgi:hypothetical protein